MDLGKVVPSRDIELKLTDRQVESLGKSMGESFAKEFWEQVSKANFTASSYPAQYFISELGRAAGKQIEKNNKAMGDKL